jgi:hypothetical protein
MVGSRYRSNESNHLLRRRARCTRLPEPPPGCYPGTAVGRTGTARKHKSRDFLGANLYSPAYGIFSRPTLLGQLLADDDRVRLVRLVLFPKGVAAEYRDTERLEVILPDGELGSAVDRPRVSGSVQLKTESMACPSPP